MQDGLHKWEKQCLNWGGAKRGHKTEHNFKSQVTTNTQSRLFSTYTIILMIREHCHNNNGFKRRKRFSIYIRKKSQQLHWLTARHLTCLFSNTRIVLASDHSSLSTFFFSFRLYHLTGRSSTENCKIFM